MVSDGEFQFGELTEDVPRRQVRPDANPHFAVRRLGGSRDEDLDVFFDLDAFRQIELQAASDTRVELGGVLLGGQFVDDEGHPFVVVHQALAAEHTENTKGSFKFTHATWSDITRQRASFPAEWRIVGWYHTHPDWGVFLSSMDLFICENFFNRPLDIALVIDPCRGDRGVFYRSQHGSREQVRAAGFHLVASRFRIHELDACVQHWEQEMLMAGRPESAWGPRSPSAPNIPPQAPAPPWLILTILGAFLLQSTLIALIAWRMAIVPEPRVEREGPELARVVERWMTEERRIWEADAKLQVVDRLLASGESGLPNAATELANREQRIAQLEASLQGLDAARRAAQELSNRRAKELEDARGQSAKRLEELTRELTHSQSEAASLRDGNERLRFDLAKIRGDGGVDAEGGTPSSVTAETPLAVSWSWWIAGAGLAVLFVAIALTYGVVAIGRRRARLVDALDGNRAATSGQQG